MMLLSVPQHAYAQSTLTGALPDGATYLIEVPASWNGTLLLYSHGYVVPGSANPARDVGDPGTRLFLLANGFALAGSSYATTGWAIHEALPDQIEEVLRTNDEVAVVASKFATAEHMFFVGRVRAWPVAREGAQKLKEISYLHAEAYQAAELKHGPLALINPAMPSVVVVPDDELLAKNISTIEQIKARGGPVIAVTNATLPAGLVDAELRVPVNSPELDPILLTIPLQMFAYHVANALGRDIDKPRNLAKSVTVE